jgi:hypothetical protein
MELRGSVARVKFADHWKEGAQGCGVISIVYARGRVRAVSRCDRADLDRERNIAIIKRIVGSAKSLIVIVLLSTSFGAMGLH